MRENLKIRNLNDLKRNSSGISGDTRSSESEFAFDVEFVVDFFLK